MARRKIGIRHRRRRRIGKDYYDPRCNSSVNDTNGIDAFADRAIERTLGFFSPATLADDRSIVDTAINESALATISRCVRSTIRLPNQTLRGVAFASSATSAIVSSASRRMAAIRRAIARSRRKRRSRTCVPAIDRSNSARRRAIEARSTSVVATCVDRIPFPTPTRSALEATQIAGSLRRLWFIASKARATASDHGAASKFIPR